MSALQVTDFWLTVQMSRAPWQHDRTAGGRASQVLTYASLRFDRGRRESRILLSEIPSRSARPVK
jgi:hypothetical protein